MSNLSVVLTSTKHMVINDAESEQIVKMDLPVCSACIGIGAFGFNASEREKMELKWSEMVKEMAKEVNIDCDKKIICIGDGELNLVEYQANDTVFHNDFLKRWKEIQTMMFEFQVFDINNESLFCLKGIWQNNEWAVLDIIPRGRIQIVY